MKTKLINFLKHSLAFVIGFLIVFLAIIGLFSLTRGYYQPWLYNLFGYGKEESTFYEETEKVEESSPEESKESAITYVLAEEVKKKLDTAPKEIIILDTRKVEDFTKEHIAEAISIPFDVLDQKYQELDKSKEIYVISPCNVCGQASDQEIFDKLKSLGFNKIKIIQGGLEDWKAKGYPLTGQ